MNFKVAALIAIATLASVPALAQQPAAQQVANPAPGCTATSAQMEANKKVAMEFFRTAGAERVALADPSYKQHNPAFKKRAEDNKVSDYEEFRTQDPTAAPGTFYEVFTFDTFRVRNGKLVEHWDGAVINPPAPAGRGN